MRTYSRGVVACGALLLVGVFTFAGGQGSPEESPAATTRMYSNLRWSIERNALVGANVRLTREGDEIRGSYIVFEENPQGTPYRFTGTARGDHITFTVRVGRTTMRFSGRMTEDELVGKMTVTQPDGTRQEKDFKARRMWRH
jgi:hypothetical protein